jgi:hypothetical protein
MKLLSFIGRKKTCSTGDTQGVIYIRDGLLDVERMEREGGVKEPCRGMNDISCLCQ